MKPTEPPRPEEPGTTAGRAQVRWPDDDAARVRSAPARVVELRADGAELRLGEPLPPGLLVSLVLDRRAVPARLLLARVSGCRECGPGEWDVTCAFPRPLGSDDLAAYG